MAGAEHFLDGIQDAGANVAIDDTDGAQGERRKGRFGCRHKKAPPASGAPELGIGYFAPVRAPCKWAVAAR